MEFSNGNWDIVGWTIKGDGSLSKSQDAYCGNQMGYEMHNTILSKSFKNLPINKSLRVSFRVNTYGFDSNEYCNVHLNNWMKSYN